MGVGALTVERFGHAALCLRWTDPRMDRCFNYGTTDFSRPIKMSWGFLRGKSSFWVSTMRPESMLANYTHRDRSIWLQTLPLTDEEAWQMADKLMSDTLPENKYYNYHHFYDNCTTRVRDIIDNATGGRLSAGADVPFPHTFRDLSRQGFADVPILLFASDAFLGHPADNKPTLYQAMFLPDVLRDEITKRYGVEPVVIYVRQGPSFPTENNWVRPFVIGLSVLFAIPMLLARVRRRRQRLLGTLSLLPAALCGLVVWFVLIATPLAEGRQNEVLMLLFPLDLAVPFLSERRRQLYVRFRIGIILLALLLKVVGLFTQPLWAVAPLSLFPLTIVAITRGDQPEASSASQQETSGNKPQRGGNRSKAGKKKRKRR